MSTEGWMTLAEIAQHLHVCEETIHRWIRTKNMPGHRVGRIWRFKASEVDDWVRSGDAGSDGNLAEEAQ